MLQAYEKCIELEGAIKNHPMCFDFIQGENYCMVIYPRGMCFDGARVDITKGKAMAYELLLSAMERHWLRSGLI